MGNVKPPRVGPEKKKSSIPKAGKTAKGQKKRVNLNRSSRGDLCALRYARKFCEAVNTPVSLSVWMLIENQQYTDLVNKTINPADYLSAGRFYLDYQCVKLLAKCRDIKTGIPLKRKAIDAFLKAELDCKATNDIIRKRWAGEFYFRPLVSSVLYRCEQKLSSLLGDVPTLSELDFDFGPGSTLSVRGDTAVPKKLESALECTFALTPIVQDLLLEFPGWIPEGIHDIDIVDGSELTFVPKNAKTDRAICIEPLLNGLYQKGIGTYLKGRLRAAGCNIDHQTTNQSLCLAALERNLATVDFSSASDTIAYNVVADLFPNPWFNFMDYGRSQYYTIEGCSYSFEKFSSMGNAYTFELETSLFYSLAWACCEAVGITPRPGYNITVFGDDVILPLQAYDLFAEVAACVGFSVNHEKSFSSGPFRESCGVDTFQGNLVTPLKIESTQGNRNVYKTANQLLEILKRVLSLDPVDGHCDRITNLWDLHAWLVGCVPRSFRFTVPATHGDCGFHAPFDVAVPRRDPTRDGWWFRCLEWEAEKLSPRDAPAGLPTWGKHPPRGESRSELVTDPGLLRSSYSRFVSGPSYRELLVLGPSHCVKAPLPPSGGPAYDSHEYTLRGKGRFVVKRIFCFGQWVDPGLPWSDRALSYVSKRTRP